MTTPRALSSVYLGPSPGFTPASVNTNIGEVIAGFPISIASIIPLNASSGQSLPPKAVSRSRADTNEDSSEKLMVFPQTVKIRKIFLLTFFILFVTRAIILWFLYVSWSKGVFDWLTPTGCEAFSSLIYLDAAKFIMLSVFDLPKNLGETTAEFCKKSTPIWRASLKKVFA